jgi:transcriptional regulator with XRE-family HTH domain
MTPQDLKDWRHRNGFSQPQLGRMLGVHVQTIRGYEHGRSPVPSWMPLALWAIEHGALKEKKS